ncbi:Transforming growth factor-beta-induced ig-h3 [Fusarium albosuccineum]|uniref:Transforming growth factor-beta-induced ig-h3 n=1 Tax=Fusarium albosuccineum TaxID=1237068 RepID=A0A8H4PK07_9HYPO|nr:Transforming growth factor-beta-induced ig-h3 [Fusarium albosuccineum]
MLLSNALFGLASVAACAEAASKIPMDLGSVLQRHEKLTTYYKLIQKYPEILMQLPNYKGVTIIAPSDDAFKQIPYSALSNVWDSDQKNTTIPLLQYHILQGTIRTDKLEAGPAYVRPTLLTDPAWCNVSHGQNILITKQPDVVVFSTRLGSRATVLNNDIEFQGGIIQIVDSVLVPPSGIGQVLTASKVQSFLGGLYDSKLMPNVGNRKDVTIFAPRDQAMEAIGGTLAKLDTKQLARVMGYHVIPGKVLVSSDLENATFLETLADGQKVHVRQIGNEKFVNSAKIISTDILLSNGILHIISNVNNPLAPNAAPDPDRWAQAPVFHRSEVDNVFQTAIPCTTNCMNNVYMTPKATAAPTPTRRVGENAAAMTPGSSSFFSSSSSGVAGARATVHVAGAALGILGVGAGMALL